MRAPLGSAGKTELGFSVDLEMEGLFRELFRLNLRFVNEHDRNIIFDRVNAVALAAFQPLSVRRKLDVGFA